MHTKRLTAARRVGNVGNVGSIRTVLVLLLGVTTVTALPAVARAQTAASTAAVTTTTAASIDPGMTRDQVVAKLGEPLSSRSYDGFTYLLYRNGCEKTCGMNDLVVLDSGKVIDAVFRSRDRHYTGTSSSPHMIPAPEARKRKSVVAQKKHET